MADKFEWHGDAAKDYVRRRAVQALTRAAIVVTRRAKELLSVPGTAFRIRSSGDHRKRSTVHGAVRSRPGEPPRKQTGRLMDSVAYEVDEKALTARVGTNVPYGRYLELGTKKGLAPRPWLRRALAESAAKITTILSGLGDS